MAQSDRPAGRRGVVGVGLFGLLGVVLVAVGVLVGALLLPQPIPASVVSPAAGTLMVSGESFDGAHQVSVSVLTDQARLLRASGFGVLTGSVCVVGGSISSGDAPFAVNNIPVLALALPLPLWRDLTSGVKGGDVSGLQTELARLGFSVAVTGVYDKQTQAAVSAALGKVGGGLAKSGMLALAQVVWLPAPSVVVSSCSLQVGDPVSAGQQVASLAGDLTGLVVDNPPGDGWVAQYGDLTTPIGADGRISDQKFLAAYEGGPEYQFYTSTGGGTLVLTILLAVPKQVVVVPPGAVIVSGVGTGCVVSDGRIIDVDIVSSSLGQTLVAPAGGVFVSVVDVAPDASVTC